MASFCLKGDTILKWSGTWSHAEVLFHNPKHVQVALKSDFKPDVTGAVVPHTTEFIWCKVNHVGREKLYCTIDNLPDFTDSHGLCLDDNIAVLPGNILQLR